MTSNDTDAPTPSNPDYHRKIVDPERLCRIVERLRNGTPNSGRSKTIVQCHGCFDIVHPGHIRYLQFARSQGSVLIVSLTGDADIDKGDQRPYIPEELRAENLAALEFVDFVVVDPNPTARELLQRIRPDVYVKGREYATSEDPNFLAERRVVESYGGRVIFSSGQVVFSSSRLIEALPQPEDMADQRLRLLCDRHGIRLASLLDTLRGAAGTRILVLGDTLVERYVLCDATDVAAESPMMSLEELDSRDYLGGAACVAAHLASLGARPTLVTSLGEDEGSNWVRERLEALGVEYRELRHRPDTPVKTRFLVDDHKMLRVSRTAVRPLDSIREAEAAGILAEEADRADAAVIHDCGYGTITPGLLQRLDDTLRGRVGLLAGGAAEPLGDLTGLANMDMLCASERQLRAAINDFGAGLSTAAYRLLQQTRAKRLLVMLGKHGLVTFDRRSHDPSSPAWEDRLSSEHLPSMTGRPVDQLGSGEAALAASSLALSQGASLMHAAYLGVAASAIQTSALGTEPVRVDALRRWLEHRPELWADDDVHAMSGSGDRTVSPAVGGDVAGSADETAVTAAN